MKMPTNVGRRAALGIRRRPRIPGAMGVMTGGSDPEEKTQLPNLQQSADLLRTSLGIHSVKDKMRYGSIELLD